MIATEYAAVAEAAAAGMAMKRFQMMAKAGGDDDSKRQGEVSPPG